VSYSVTTRSDGDHGPVARGGHHVAELVEVRDVSPKTATGLSRCADIWIANIERSSALRENRCEQKYSGVSSPAATTFPPTVPQGDGVHQAQGDRDSTMSGSVEATTAIALMMMSSGTPASRMAATRCPATAARSSWLIPRPAWAWSSGRPS
jgi:hypothetical protein